MGGVSTAEADGSPGGGSAITKQEAKIKRQDAKAAKEECDALLTDFGW
jgi:hypothetical protein